MTRFCARSARLRQSIDGIPWYVPYFLPSGLGPIVVRKIMPRYLAGQSWP